MQKKPIRIFRKTCGSVRFRFRNAKTNKPHPNRTDLD
jgi:hypothetical protein